MTDYNAEPLAVRVEYNDKTRVLSFADNTYGGTTADNLATVIIIDGLDDYADYDADIIFGIPLYHNGKAFYPFGRIEDGEYVIPNAILMHATDGVLPIELRLTKDNEVINSRNRLPIKVRVTVDSLGTVDDAFRPEIYGRSMFWDAAMTYQKDAIVLYGDFTYYSLTDGNKGNNPADGEEWAELIDLVKGAKGEQGEQGPPGRDGVDGKDGEQGPPGRDGKDGIDGLPGRDGTDGLPGRDGEQGEQGEQGPPGRDGIDGEQGPPGRDGKDGVDGKDGLPGKDGERGEQGPPGRDGKDGIDGLPGKDGEQGPPGATTIEGIDGLQSALDDKVDKNASIVAGEYPKIEYDSKGLVLKGSALGESDIPSLSAGKITSGTLGVDRIPQLAQSKIDGLGTALGLKADVTALNTHTGNTSNPHGVTKAQVGLGAYPASPADIGISTATQTALDGTVKKTGDTMTGRLYANDGVTVEGATEPVMYYKRTDRSYDSPWARYRWDRIFDKDNKSVGEITFTCADNDPNYGRLSHASLRAMNYKDDGTRVDSTVGVNAMGSGERYVTLPMRSSPGSSDAVNTRYVLDQVVGMVDYVDGEVGDHEARKDNPHSVTKAQVGLGSVDNTSDTAKPISTATQIALDSKADKTYVDTAIQSAIYDAWNEAI